MTQQRDYLALEWLLGEIEVSLQRCVPVIEARLSGEAAEPDSLDEVRSTLHQVAGSLQMVEFSGDALLVKEMERAFVAVIDGAVGSQAANTVLTALRQLVQALPNYLRQRLHLRRELPVSLMLLINDLRAARGQVLLSSTVLFSPLAQVAPASQAVPSLDTATVEELISKLRQMYQIALSSYLEDKEPQRSLEYLSKVCARAGKLCAGQASQNMWLAAAALMESLAQGEFAGGYQAGEAVVSLLRRLDRELRHLGDKQRAAVAPDSLLRDLLFYVSCSRSGSELVKGVKVRHQLCDNLLAPDMQQQRLAEPAALAVVEELDDLGRQLIAGVASSELRMRCLDLGDALAVLGEVQSMHTLQAVSEVLTDDVSDVQRQSAADTLGLLSQSLSRGPLEQDSEPPQAVVVDSVVGEDERRQQYRLARRALIGQSRGILADTQDAIMSYVAEGWLARELQDVPGRLQELSSALYTAAMLEPAQVIERCAAYISEQLIAAGHSPDWSTLDALADALTSLDYYLERNVTADTEQDSALLDTAADCVARLGYPVPGRRTSADIIPLPTAPATPSSGAAESSRADQQKDTAKGAVALDPDVLEIFVEEAREVIEALTAALPKLAQLPPEGAVLADVRRAFHTLKGSGRMAGAEQCGELAWSVENMLNKVVEGRFTLDPPRCQVVEQVTAILPELVNELEQHRELASTRLQPFIAAAEALAEQQTPQLESRFTEVDTQGDELISVFIAEADVHLAEIDSYLQGIYSYPAKLSDELQRSLHTLKGASRMAEVWAVASIIAPLEGLVKELRSMRVPADEHLISLIGDVAEETRRLTDQLHTLDASELETPEALVTRVNTTAAVMIDAAEQSQAQRQHGQIPAGVLNAFLATFGDHIQSLMDHLAQPEQFDGQLLADYTAIMGQFANRAEEIGSETTAEMAQALQVLFSHTKAPIDQQFVDLVSKALDQLMDDLNQLAAEQSAEENSGLLDMLREYESATDDTAGYGASIPPETAGNDGAAAPVAPFAEPAPEPEPQAEPESTTAIAADGDNTPARSEPEDDIDPEILEIFLEEAHDLLENMDSALHAWSEQPDNPQFIDDIQRYLHTLKGGARLSGLPGIGDQSHDFETMLANGAAYGNKASLLLAEAQQHQDRLVAAVDAVAKGEIPARVDTSAANNDGATAEPLVAEAVEDHAPATQNEPAPVADSNDVVPVVEGDASKALERGDAEGVLMAAQLSRGPQEMIKVPAQLLEQLINLAGETSIARSRVEEQVVDMHFSLDEMDMTISRLQDQVRRIDLETEAQIVHRQEQIESEGAEGFDALEFDRYSQLQQLSRSLLESASDLIDLRSTVVDKSRDMETLLMQQSRVNTELQEGLMRSQMVHFARMVPRLRRGVRQVSGELGKRVEFRVYNADGEMDRRVLERILPALEHMLRNAIDHGIESEAQRREAGKSEVGEIAMRFERQGGDVVIQIWDDGGGVDLAAVRRKAESLGLITSDAELTDRQLLEYIFHAGFTTSDSISQISGRGVGMDVVRSEIKQLGGSVDINSQRGQGTRFEIRLPFTVSVNRALMVSVGGEVYAVPLNNIEGIVRVSPYELEEYYQEDGPDFEYAGQQYQIQYMGQLLGFAHPHLESSTEQRPVLLVRNADQPTAVQVDGLMGSREVVVKSLGPQFAAVPGLSGATVLGDGSVVIIVDMLASLRASSARQLASGDQGIALEESGEKRVMVVDDSVTVRKVTSRLLQRQRMEVMLARDGMDAVTQLQDMELLPDVILLDIEMPRMDGFEVAGRLRSNPRLQNIPIIMISSRTGSKHRQRAEGLGIDAFLGKPYQEMQLLKTIDDVLATAEVS